MNARLESEMNELLGFLWSKDQKTREIAIKAAAGFEHDGAEALLLMGLSDENPQIAWMAALELLKKGKMDVDEADHICMLAPLKRKTEAILKASQLENKPLAAALLSHWLEDKDSGISDMAKKKLSELGEHAKEKAEIPASKAPSKDLRTSAREGAVPVDRDAVRKAFRPPKPNGAGERLTAYQKIQQRLK